MKQNKILILHDTFLYKGGGERLIMMMGKALKADIASGFFSAGSFDLRKEGFTGKIISVSSEIFTKGLRHIKLKLAFLFQTRFIADYETIVFSGDCISAVRNGSPSTKKIYYCHTPPRYLYDLREIYMQKVPVLLRPIFICVSYIFRKLYERDIAQMDIILTNSKNTQQRLSKFLCAESHILYPPVDTSTFQYIGQQDYYLSFARLSDAKRVDRIVDAFMYMPDKKLKVIYGENDPHKDSIFSLAQGYSNIEFITLPGNIGFAEMIGNCIATIYIPIDEDFGMSPLESMSAGKPVLGVDEGGLKETIIDQKTGILMKPNFDRDDIIQAIDRLDPNTCLSMRDDCERRASDFGLESFEKQLKNLIS